MLGKRTSGEIDAFLSVCKTAGLEAHTGFDNDLKFLIEQIENRAQKNGKKQERSNVVSWLLTNNMRVQIVGALQCMIQDHGPVTKEMIGSATKRINGSIREERKRLAEKYKLS